MHRGAEKLFEVRDYRQIIVLANRHDWLQRLLQRARRRARRRADARHGGARTRRLGAHRARRAQPGAQPPDVPRQLPPRARRDHAGLLRVPRARGAPGRHGGGLRRPHALHVQPRRRPQGGPPGRVDRPRRQGDRQRAQAASRPRAPHRRQRDPRGPHPRRRGAAAVDGPGVRRLRSDRAGQRPRRRPAPRRRPTSPTASSSATRAPAASSPAPPATASPASRCSSSRCTSALDLAEACLDRLVQLPARARSTSSCPRCSRCPRARSTCATENPLGFNGYYLVSRGEKTPWRLKLRSASFNNVAVLSEMLPGQLIADMVAILGSMFFVVGDVDK